MPESALDSVLRGYISATRAIVMGVSVAVFALMVAVNGLEIVGRALFQKSFSWVQEVSILGAMWIYFFTYSLVAKNEEYIRIEFITNRMLEPHRRATLIGSRLVTLLFHATLAWFAIETYWFLSLFTTSVLGWPESLFVLPILLGSFDIVVTEAIHLRWQLMGREFRPHLPPAGVD
jgi:TRAP-type C4-dicarboxylate transport system permease small subunit